MPGSSVIARTAPPSPSQGLRPWQRLLAPPGVNVDNFYGSPMLTLPLLKAIKTWSGTVKIGDVRTLTLLTPYPPPPPGPSQGSTARMETHAVSLRPRRPTVMLAEFRAAAVLPIIEGTERSQNFIRRRAR